MYIALVLILIVTLFLIITYNSFIKKKLLVEEAFSGIDIQLKKRYNIIPNVLETVKGFAAHERGTFENVVAARNVAIAAKTTEDQVKAENQLNQSLVDLFALAEQYPNLTSSPNFIKLHQALVEIEDDIEHARRYFNGSVRNYNTKLATFPNNILASIFNFKPFNFFEVENITARTLPKVSFTK